MAKKYVYLFGGRGTKAEGSADMKDILGGKGANLAEMTNLGIPVPPGFTISTEMCAIYYETKGLPKELKTQVKEAIRKVERIMGLGYGDVEAPLLKLARGIDHSGGVAPLHFVADPIGVVRPPLLEPRAAQVVIVAPPNDVLLQHASLLGPRCGRSGHGAAKPHGVADGAGWLDRWMGGWIAAGRRGRGSLAHRPGDVPAGPAAASSGWPTTPL